MKSTINISEEYTKFPGLRYESLTEGTSGEKFREDYLIPAIEEHGSVTVIMDGNIGAYVPSFLEECFGGLVRAKNFTLDAFKKKVKIVSDNNPDLIEDIMYYVEKAVKK